MARDKRKTCNNLKLNTARCSCPQDCPRKGTCCECIEFHAALGEVPFCVVNIAGVDARCSATGGALSRETQKEIPAEPAEIITLDTPGFRLTDYASCPG